MEKETVNGVKIVCSKCGSDDIVEKCWINPNSGETFGLDGSDECYCKRCGKFTQWKEVRPTIKKRTAYLVAISPIVRVVVEEKETIAETHEKAIKMAIGKILANPEEYINDENIEDVFEDLECPAK